MPRSPQQQGLLPHNFTVFWCCLQRLWVNKTLQVHGSHREGEPALHPGSRRGNLRLPVRSGVWVQRLKSFGSWWSWCMLQVSCHANVTWHGLPIIRLHHQCWLPASRPVWAGICQTTAFQSAQRTLLPRCALCGGPRAGKAPRPLHSAKPDRARAPAPYHPGTILHPAKQHHAPLLPSARSACWMSSPRTTTAQTTASRCSPTSCTRTSPASCTTAATRWTLCGTAWW